MKTCPRCGESGESVLFYKNKSTVDGYSHYCRKCVRACVKKSYGKHRESARARAREYLKRPEVIARVKLRKRGPGHKEYIERWRKTERGSNLIRASQYKRNYGITLREYENKFISQNGACAICKKHNLNGKRLFVDHDHKTNQVRGLLCHLCNSALGQVKEDFHILNAMYDYLETWGRVSAVSK